VQIDEPEQVAHLLLFNEGTQNETR